ncbi:hypothetical protein SLEP1_g59806, partial [Rubroshorea leprosula]
AGAIPPSPVNVNFFSLQERTLHPEEKKRSITSLQLGLKFLTKSEDKYRNNQYKVLLLLLDMERGEQRYVA